MTKAKKLTAIDAPELTQEHVNTITDPRMRAALQNMLDIVKDAPPIPGLVELEERYGAGNIPMLAVHESKLLTLDEKKFLFEVAGYAYDGTAPKEKLVTKGTRTPIQKRDAAEARAYEAYKEVLDAAFKSDGFRGIVRYSRSLVDQATSLADNHSARKSEVAGRTEIAAFMASMWVGLQLADIADIDKAGGLDAVIAAQAEE